MLVSVAYGWADQVNESVAGNKNGERLFTNVQRKADQC